MHYLQQVNEIMQRARNLGERRLKNGAQLIGHVPHVAPEAWLHAMYPPIHDFEIRELESQIGIHFPEEFSDFLNLCNGLSLFSGELSIYGRRESYSRTDLDDVWQAFDIVTPNTLERLRDAKPTYLFVGGYPCGKGYYVYIDTSNGAVARCTRRSAHALATWKFFPEMLLSEAIRLSHLFDSRGMLINPDEPTVPD